MESGQELGFLQRAKNRSKPDVDTQKKEPPAFLGRAKNVSPSTQESSPYDDPEFLEREIDRNQAQLFSRAAEAVLGMPSDIISLLGHYTGLDLKKMQMSEDETKEAGLEEGEGFKLGHREVPFTSSHLRNLSEKATGGYTEPQNEFEEKTGHIVQNVAGRHIPIGRPGIFSRFMVPFAGEGAEVGAKKLGINDTNASRINYATQIALDLWGGANPSGVVEDLYHTSRQQARGLSLNAAPIQNRVVQLRDAWRRELRGSDNPGVRILDELEGAATNGRYTAEQLMDARRRVNSTRQDLGHFTVGPGTRGTGRRALQEVDEILNDALDFLGQTNPEFLQTYRQASTAHRAIQQSNTISDYISKNYTDGFLSKTAPLLFASATHATPSTLGQLGKSAMSGAKFMSVAYPVYKFGQATWRVFNSPALARHYAEIVAISSMRPSGQEAQKKQQEKLSKEMRDFDEELFKLETKGEL